MQSIGSTLRHASSSLTCARRVLQSSQIASTSRVVRFDIARHASSSGAFGWLRSNLGLGSKGSAETQAEEQRGADLLEPTPVLQQPGHVDEGQLSVFESVPSVTETTSGASKRPQKEHTHHKYSTANFKISHRKLNKLGRQISGKPIDMAILQMMFSEKRASKRVKSMLAIARSHAINYKGLEEQKLVVAEAWVTKGPKVQKRLDIRARGKYGIREHPDSRLHVVLKEGKTRAQLLEEERARKLKRIVSAGLNRENVPLRNPSPRWAW
ncbi:ribosomal protein L22 [Obba rivulosa]|uniref:Ribosomal protein L22 n=1 Tax=Obba rivulosa TaxID=1052685 RepID=A0A8E2DMJ7_9APHY|nr:ribosomal protein L22 [Obba rivulosa]